MSDSASSQKHQRLQRAITGKFRERFAPNSQLIYQAGMGSTHHSSVMPNTSSFPMNERMPDVILYDESRHWLFLIEAITSQGPITETRKEELQKYFESGSTRCVYVSAFNSFAAYKKVINQIAWETEVWLADMPDHMIHYNGDRFLGPHR